MVYYTKLTSSEIQKLREWMRKVQEEKASLSYVDSTFVTQALLDYQNYATRTYVDSTFLPLTTTDFTALSVLTKPVATQEWVYLQNYVANNVAASFPSVLLGGVSSTTSTNVLKIQTGLTITNITAAKLIGIPNPPPTGKSFIISDTTPSLLGVQLGSASLSDAASVMFLNTSAGQTSISIEALKNTNYLTSVTGGNIQVQLDGKQAAGSYALSSDITTLQTAIDGKQATGTCITLGGAQTLTANITVAADTYTFMGAKPSEIAKLSGVTSIMTRGGAQTLTADLTTASTFKIFGATTSEIALLSGLTGGTLQTQLAAKQATSTCLLLTGGTVSGATTINNTLTTNKTNTGGLYCSGGYYSYTVININPGTVTTISFANVGSPPRGYYAYSWMRTDTLVDDYSCGTLFSGGSAFLKFTQDFSATGSGITFSGTNLTCTAPSVGTAHTMVMSLNRLA